MGPPQNSGTILGMHIEWVRNVSNGSNASQLATLQNSLSVITLNDSEDAWVWTIDYPSFSVKNARCHIDRGLLPQDASTVWSCVFKWLDLQPPTVSSLNGLYSWIAGIHMSPTKRAILDVISGAVLWSLWSFRNETIFGTDHPKRNLLFDKIVDYSFRWYSSRCKLHFISWNNWIQNPLVVYSL
ncbi:hypothetical protein CTI12_AA524800 [Artemisia annua]|uniref:RNA-directed DNA polymerase, eukaryota, Reverse transcriptase zinc-binding domain protein n=1 Tax=Artemisia annua TaxID=35608 RepID=A0A2U1L5W6_ARTAN|nr:hypothetical protein CTI12_AA524800 [Artemisia annua]